MIPLQQPAINGWTYSQKPLFSGDNSHLWNLLLPVWQQGDNDTAKYDKDIEVKNECDRSGI